MDDQQNTHDSFAENEITETKIMKILDWTYDKAVNGGPGLDSASRIADYYMAKEGSRIKQANAMIRWQNTKAGTSGFITGLGGLLTMPVTLPAGMTIALYVQLRMIAAIAYMGGHNLQDERVKSIIFACLTGNAARGILKDIGFSIGTQITATILKSISGKAITVINKKVGFRLLSRLSEKGMGNFSKAVPLVGGVIGATFDSFTTNSIGNTARDTFLPFEK